MNDLDGLLSSDFGFKPQGKSAPMSAPKASANANARSANSPLDFDFGSRSSNYDSDSIFGSRGAQKPPSRDEFDDLFGGPPKRKDNSFDLDSMFGQGSKSSSSLPVYDKPVYDDDIFEGVPGVKSFSSASSGMKYDVFESVAGSSPPNTNAGGSSAFDDLLGGFGKEGSQPKNKVPPAKEDTVMPDFDDLIPGFGGSSPQSERSTSKPSWSSEPTTTSRKATEDPFAELGSASPHVASSSGLTADPLEELSKLGKHESTKADGPSVSNGAMYDDLDPFDSYTKSVPSSSFESISNRKEGSPLRTERVGSMSHSYNSEEQADKISSRSVGSRSHRPVSVDIDLESHQTFFDMSSASNSFSEPTSQTASGPFVGEANIPVDVSPRYEENDVWLSVSEIPLFTQPTNAPPPSRPPPPRPARASKGGTSSFGSADVKKADFSYANSNFDVPKSVPEAKSTMLDDLEDFSTGRSSRYNFDAHTNGVSNEDLGLDSDAAASAAAMKEAMDRAEAKFRHAKEVRERESTRAARNRESVQLEKDETWLDSEERALKEKQEQLQKMREEEERERRRIEKEKEREQRRLEKERERAREERDRARQAVERATREARERAAVEARAKAERAAVEKANAEARELAERAAVLRAQAEARERAAAEARERAERAAAEAREREAREKAEARARAEKEAADTREKEARERAAEARRRAERAAVERAAAEARGRAAADARERAAAAARASQQKNDNDLENFFKMGRASSEPRQRANSNDPFGGQVSSKKVPEAARTSDATAASMRKASSTTNIVDDLSSIFGGVPTSGEFQEVEGESEERRRARMERHQRTQERAAKALAEKNERDLQAQREQAERHRISESLDVEIKRWAAGKEGNLRALLSTLQYVLWPECGWQTVSLTDLITGAAVKKVYRKATLCIHPDKVQQKGANLQQKYIAEKVFDLLKEAWNKLNSEELF